MKGKDYSNGGNAFLVTDIFKIANRSMVIGKPLQYINVGDTLYLGDKGFKVWNMQKGKLIVDHAEPTDIQIGIIFEDYKMENIKKGATLVFREEEQQ